MEIISENIAKAMRVVVEWDASTRINIPAVARHKSGKIILPARGFEPRAGERWEIELIERDRYFIAKPIRPLIQQVRFGYDLYGQPRFVTIWEPLRKREPPRSVEDLPLEREKEWDEILRLKKYLPEDVREGIEKLEKKLKEDYEKAKQEVLELKKVVSEFYSEKIAPLEEKIDTLKLEALKYTKVRPYILERLANIPFIEHNPEKYAELVKKANELEEKRRELIIGLWNLIRKWDERRYIFMLVNGCYDCNRALKCAELFIRLETKGNIPTEHNMEEILKGVKNPACERRKVVERRW